MKASFIKKTMLCCAALVLSSACAPSSVPLVSAEASNDDGLKILDQIPRLIQIYDDDTGFKLSLSGDAPYDLLYKTLYTELQSQLREENIPANQQENVDWLYRIEVSRRPNHPIYTVYVSDTLISLNGVQYRQGSLTDTLLSCVAVSKIESILLTDPSGMAVRFSEDMTSEQWFYPIVCALAQSHVQPVSPNVQLDAYYDLEIITGDHARTTCRVTPDALRTGGNWVANSGAYAAADALFRQHIVYPTV